MSGRSGRTGVTHYSRLANLLDGAQHGCPTWTLHVEEIERGLVEHMTTVAFEHLMVAPLQLDHPSEVWQHTRGPGDAGARGTGGEFRGHAVLLPRILSWNPHRNWPEW